MDDSKADYLKSMKGLESRIDTMQSELIKMLTRFFHDVIENQNNMKEDISKLSQRMYKIEEMSLNRSTASRKGSMDTLNSKGSYSFFHFLGPNDIIYY